VGDRALRPHQGNAEAVGELPRVDRIQGAGEEKTLTGKWLKLAPGASNHPFVAVGEGVLLSNGGWLPSAVLFDRRKSR
jgi:hypothetical protein